MIYVLRSKRVKRTFDQPAARCSARRRAWDGSVEIAEGLQIVETPRSPSISRTPQASGGPRSSPALGSACWTPEPMQGSSTVRSFLLLESIRPEIYRARGAAPNQNFKTGRSSV